MHRSCIHRVSNLVITVVGEASLKAQLLQDTNYSEFKEGQPQQNHPWEEYSLVYIRYIDKD